MNDQQQALASRAVACKHWRWMPGMRGIRRGAWSENDSYRVPETLPNGGVIDWLPDLTDPATLGCLLALVREAWTDKGAYICTLHYASKWFIDLPNGEVVCCDTEAEALVAALEAAP